jgi:nucleoid-associated protein YgaU
MNSVNVISMSRLIVTIAAVVAALGAAAFVVNRHLQPPIETATPAVAPADAKQASAASDQAPAALAAVRQNVDELAAGLTGSPLPQASRDGAPEFDIVRIEPSGEAVVAGRAAPGSTVELLRNGEPHDRAVANQSGEFAMIPRPLPRGTYDLTLRAKQPDGKELTSRQSVAVALEPAATDQKPMVALMAPDRPTVVLSQPAAPAAGAVAVDAVDVEPNGKTHVSGRARPGAAVRLYLNDSFVAPVTADADGRFAVTINQGVAPGNYRVRLDEVDSSGKVRARAEAPFSVPEFAVTASVPAQVAAAATPDTSAAREPHSAVAVATAAPEATSPSSVVVPKIATITVSRGDSLWRISQRSLGAGTRYATVFRANKEQIRNPNLIYPGQIFVLPAGEARR